MKRWLFAVVVCCTTNLLQAQYFTGEVFYLVTFDLMQQLGEPIRANDTLRLAFAQNGLLQTYLHDGSPLLHLTDGVYVLAQPPSQGVWLQQQSHAMQLPLPKVQPTATLKAIKRDTLLGIVCTHYERRTNVFRHSINRSVPHVEHYWLADKFLIPKHWQERVPYQPWWAHPATGKLVLRYEEYIDTSLALRYEAIRVKTIRHYQIQVTAFQAAFPYNEYILDTLLQPIRMRVWTKPRETHED